MFSVDFVEKTYDQVPWSGSVMQALYQTIVIKRVLNPKVKLSNCQSIYSTFQESPTVWSPALDYD